MKVTELTTIVGQLQHEVDSMGIPLSEDGDEGDDDEADSPPPTTTEFSKRSHSVVVPAPETRQTSSAQDSTPSAPGPAQAPSVSTPPAPRTSAEASADVVFLTPSSAAQRDE